MRSLILLILFAFPAHAAVSLSGAVFPTSAKVGDTAFVTVFADVPAGDAFTGGSVNLTTDGTLTLINRDIAETAIVFPYLPDHDGPGLPGVLDEPQLTSLSGASYDLGGDIADPTKPLGPGHYPLGQYWLTADEFAPLVSIQIDGLGYYSDDGNAIHAYAHGDAVTFSMVGTPEPSMLAFGLLAYLLMRRSRSN